MADVTIDMDVLERYADGVHQIGAAARQDMGFTLANVDLSDRELVEDLVAGACRYAQEASAQYAAQFYRGLSILQTGEDFDAKALSDYDRQATIIAVRGIYRQATRDGELDEEELARLLADRIEYEVNRASKVGVWKNGQRDQRDVRYARVPVGAETCAWCLMTAGLGYWFMTEEAASHTHRSCDCQIIASIGRGEVHISGYDSTVYRDMWRTANRLRANGDIPQEWTDHIAQVHAQRDREGRPYRDATNGTLYVMRKMYDLK